MATGPSPSPSPPSPPSSTSTSPIPPVTSCPQCGALCLGAVLLPCGHLTCRKCLRDWRHDNVQFTCCTRPAQLSRDKGVPQLVKELGTDPVIYQLVQEQFDNMSDINCLNCDNKHAVKVCLDCHEFYCDHCSSIHVKTRLLRDHDLHPLSHGLRNAPSAAPVSLRPRSSSITSTSSVDSIRYSGDTGSRGQPRGVEQWRDWRKKEMNLLDECHREDEDMKSDLTHIASMTQKLLDRMDSHRDIIHTYHQRLSLFDVKDNQSPNLYVIRSTGCDVDMEVNTESLKKRLMDIRRWRHRPDEKAVKSIGTQLQQLLYTSDKKTRAATSTPSVSTLSPYLPLTHAPTPPEPSASHLHPASPTPSVNVTTAKIQRVFTASPRTAEEMVMPHITSIVCLADDRMAMTDYCNEKVKVMEVVSPYIVSDSITLGERPSCLAVLSDGLLAVTTYDKPIIYLLDVSPALSVRSTINTGKEYYGVAGLSDLTLIVCCGKKYFSSPPVPAAVDVISRSGDVIRTVVDGTTLPGLTFPLYLCVDGDHVLVSDHKTDVHRVTISSGHVAKTCKHPDIRLPCQVCSDSHRNMFVASVGGRCVVVRSREGQWTQLLSSSIHSDPPYDYPYGVCVSASGRVVVAWCHADTDESVVIGYQLTPC